ncbi:hypothetical protein [Clavibacter tessellarius]|uniref:hypothetical protein n=1 Tax=Clavibacter tessellarius TaxID=31965 RepID=UPI00325322FF
MTDDVDPDDVAAQLRAVLAMLPPDEQDMLPRDDRGQPRLEVVQALYRHDQSKPGEHLWTEVRELDPDEFVAANDALSAVYRRTRGLNAFPAFAWGDLDTAKTEFLRQVHHDGRFSEWMASLIEYRLINFSTAVKLYQEQVLTQAKHAADEALHPQLKAMFSEVYDRSFAYRVLYSIRNAFHHGDRRLISLSGTSRLKGPSGGDIETDGVALLDKAAFAAGESNGAVRREIRELGEDIEVDLFRLSSQTFSEIELLSDRIIPLLHPAAPQAAALLAGYFGELDGQRPHFHEYIRGLPLKGFLELPLLTGCHLPTWRRRRGSRAVYENGPASDITSVLPIYPPLLMSTSTRRVAPGAVRLGVLFGGCLGDRLCGNLIQPAPEGLRLLSASCRPFGFRLI